MASAPILDGLKVVELSAFVAAPLGGATLASLGAEVIRIDPLGGGIDAKRWPLHDGESIYWSGLNAGKKSLTIDTRSEAGQELATSLIAEAGIVLTNLRVHGWNSYERLSARRPDLIMAVLTGNPDGSPAKPNTSFKPHPMQGWSPNFIPKITAEAIDAGVISRVVTIAGPDAMKCSRDLALQEGILVGITAGATFAGALEVAKSAAPGSTILCMLPDTGERYLSTPLFAHIAADMNDDEVAISASTPNHRLPPKPAA